MFWFSKASYLVRLLIHRVTCEHGPFHCPWFHCPRDQILRLSQLYSPPMKMPGSGRLFPASLPEVGAQKELCGAQLEHFSFKFPKYSRISGRSRYLEIRFAVFYLLGIHLASHALFSLCLKTCLNLVLIRRQRVSYQL